MVQPKRVAYPNLVDQIKATVEAHAAIHDEVSTHVQEHRAKLEDKRRQLHVAEIAKKLIEGDGKS